MSSADDQGITASWQLVSMGSQGQRQFPPQVPPLRAIHHERYFGFLARAVAGDSLQDFTDGRRQGSASNRLHDFSARKEAHQIAQRLR
jgi:hypothetical protein